jgi:hypothetical protein
MQITFATTDAWKECIQELVRLNVDFATGNENNKTVHIYSGEHKFEHLISGCGFVFNPYEDYPG